MEMPDVSECDATECAYNVNHQCHALAITIGDSGNPSCDTFCLSSTKGGDMGSTAGVGACKTSSCRFNMDLECSALSICVGYMGNDVDCLTFESR